MNQCKIDHFADIGSQYCSRKREHT